MISTTLRADNNVKKDRRGTVRKLSCGIRGKAGDIIVRLTAVLFWLGVWQICSAAVNKEILLPSPVDVLKRLAGLAAGKEFWLYCFGSLLRIMSGFALAFILGSAMGALNYRSPLARRLSDPLLSVIKATPVASFIILALVWIKSMLMPVFISFLIVLPIVCSNIYEGLRNTDPRLLEMCDIFGIPKKKRVFAVYIPSAAPYALAAVRTGLGLAWKAGVAAEVIGRTARSVGDMLYQSKLYLETVDLFAWTAAVVILSRLLEAAVVRCADRLSLRFAAARGEEDIADDKA